MTLIRRLQLGVGLFAAVVAPAGIRSCARTPGPSITTIVGEPLPWRTEQPHRFEGRTETPLRLGRLEVGQWRSGCTGFYGPAVRLGERNLRLPSNVETQEANWAALTRQGEERVVLAFESEETIDLVETRNGGLTFLHLARVGVPRGARLRTLKSGHEFFALDLELAPFELEAQSWSRRAVAKVLGRGPQLRLESFDRGSHFSATLGDWLIATLP